MWLDCSEKGASIVFLLAGGIGDVVIKFRQCWLVPVNPFCVLVIFG